MMPLRTGAACCSLLAAAFLALPASAQDTGQQAALAAAQEQNRAAGSFLTEAQREDLINDLVNIYINRNDRIDRDAASQAQRQQTENQAFGAIDAVDYDDNVGRAEAVYNAAIILLNNGNEDVLASLHRMETMGQQLAVISQRRIDLAAANPNTNPAQLRRMREMAIQMANVRVLVNNNIEQITRTIGNSSSQLQASRAEIIAAIERGNLSPLRNSITAQQRVLAAQLVIVNRAEGHLTRFEQSLNQNTATPQVAPPSQPTVLPPPVALPAAPEVDPAPVPAAQSTYRPVRRGTIPPDDPYEGLRVPVNLGGTGPAINVPAGNAAQVAQRAASAALPPDLTAEEQAEYNARRTEWLRQQAMQRARDDNGQIDGLPSNSDRVDDFEFGNRNTRMIPLEIRPFGGSSAGGGSGSSGQMSGGEWEWDADGGCCRVSPTDAFLFANGAGDAAARARALALAAQPDTWRTFEMGGTITVAELVPIYDGYDWWNAPIGSSGRSLSSAGTSLSSAGNSLSSAGNSLSSAGSITPSSAPTGMRVDWGGYNLAADPFRVANGGRPEPGSYADMLRQINGPGPSLVSTNPWTDAPWATSNRDLARALYGPLWSDRPYRVQADPYGLRGQPSGGPELANLYDTDIDVYLRLLGSDFDFLRLLLASDRGGLDRLLAQPFNVLLIWGPNAYDLDLHMTGPLDTPAERFHIYYAAPGQLEAQPFASLIRDCVCASGSEVILTSALNRGSGVYRVSVFNFGDQSATSTNLANQSDAILQIVRGGVAVPAGNGTTIEGGVTLLTVNVPQGQAGNTWIAAEINPNNGRITSPGVIVQSGGSDGVN